jgi:hypothetical protein
MQKAAGKTGLDLLMERSTAMKKSDKIKAESKKKPEVKTEKVEKPAEKRSVPVEPVEKIDKPRKLAGVGIISTIVECLKAGWTTKAAIHQILVEKFPDRKADGMKSTVSIQLGPTRLAKKYKLLKDGDKYRIEG